MLRCTKCKLEKDEHEFYNDKRRSNGKQSWCKKCRCSDNKTRQQLRYKNDPDYRKKINDYNNKIQTRLRRIAGIKPRKSNDDLDHTIDIIKQIDNDSPNYVRRMELTINPCTILKAHAIILKDDPNRLTTSFIQEIIGRSCNLDESEELN